MEAAMRHDRKREISALEVIAGGTLFAALAGQVWFLGWLLALP
jgi:hypothetical protein